MRLYFTWCRVQTFVAKRMKAYQSRLMTAKDNRVNLTNEVLTGIKLIKLYAWEKDFLARIHDLRNKELKELMSYMVGGGATCVFFPQHDELCTCASGD